MDCKYIENLLERFWKCETSQEEEGILRAFFRQKDIPQSLEPYRSLFVYEDEAKETKLGADFDEKILKLVEQPSAPHNVSVAVAPVLQGRGGSGNRACFGKRGTALVQPRGQLGSRLQLCHI